MAGLSCGLYKMESIFEVKNRNQFIPSMSSKEREQKYSRLEKRCRKSSRIKSLDSKTKWEFLGSGNCLNPMYMSDYNKINRHFLDAVPDVTEMTESRSLL